MRLALLLLPVLASAAIRFEDSTAKSGVAFTLRNAAAGRYRQVELMPGGVAAFDFNSDGCADLYFTNGAALPSLRKSTPEYSNRLYRGKCDGTFEDVTAPSGTKGEGYSMAAATADYDNDGRSDIFVAGVNANILYRNRGDGTFEDVTAAAGVAGVDAKLGKLWSVGGVWFDYDLDGRLDLFVVNYVLWDPRTEGTCGPPDNRLYCHPDNYKGTPNQLFRNKGDGTFEDVTERSGIGRSIGKGMGAAMADFDADGRPDIFVANDSVRNFLFRNRGDGTFEEMALKAGVALPDSGEAIAGMGADFRDIDNDGRPDIVLTGMVNDSFPLYRNMGGTAMFEERTAQSGLAVVTRQWTGWGMGIFDFDNDGRKDLFFANSHFPQLGRYLGSDAKLAAAVLRNEPDGRFTAGAASEEKAYWRGAAFADFDNDGRVDVALSALNSPARILRNTSSAGRWLALRLEGTKSNRDGIGARVTVKLAGGGTLSNHMTTAVGYASSSEAVVRFGLGTAGAADEVEIAWPSGAVERRKNVTAGAAHAIKEQR